MSDHSPSFGTIDKPPPAPPTRDRFRIAVFGDFTGRSANGLMEIGAKLAGRRAVILDIDTLDDIIENFATTLVLPIGKDSAGIEVRLNNLDDLHPDELFDNVEIFQEVSGLKQRLAIGSLSERTVADLQIWSETYATKLRLPKSSKANVVPADRRLSDFQVLIGDTSVRPRIASEADDLIARIVGPYIEAAPDKDIPAMQSALDDALASAMRLVLHHPEFQAVESQWRSLEFLARNIETDEDLEIVLFDVSAEELAADLAAGENLEASGLYELLNDAAMAGGGSGAGVGGFSAMFGLYTFEETPPHAELLGRIAKIAASVDAPFFTALSPAFLDLPIAERHPLVSRAWDRLRRLPEANYLGLASPRFMLRRTYGAKSDPISAFRFDEFTYTEGLSGLLWANPVVLVATLLAKSFTNDGWDMSLGKIMSLGDIPFQIVNDKYGDPVALPKIERNLTSAKMDIFARRGIMPVVSVKGRDEIRLASFFAIGGSPVFGPWSGPKRLDALEIARQKKTEDKNVEILKPVTDESTATPEPELVTPAADPEADIPEDEINDASLDELLAGFSDIEEENDKDDDEMDAELAALLEGLT